MPSTVREDDDDFWRQNKIRGYYDHDHHSMYSKMRIIIGMSKQACIIIHLIQHPVDVQQNRHLTIVDLVRLLERMLLERILLPHHQGQGSALILPATQNDGGEHYNVVNRWTRLLLQLRVAADPSMLSSPRNDAL